MKHIDAFLNNITMYRLTLYYLIGLVIAACLLSLLGLLPFNTLDILIASGTSVIVAYVANVVFAKVFGAVTNVESVFITALILTLLIPVQLPKSLPSIILAAGTAMASKYLLTIEKKHVFNPAAVAIAMISLLSPEHTATWWIGSGAMWPFVLIGGLLLARKIRRERVISIFIGAVVIFSAAVSFSKTGSLSNILSTWNILFFHSALLFFTFVMLIEPLTMPSTKKMRTIYGLIVSFLYVTPQMNFVPYAFTPELALCAGNIFTYFSGPQYRLLLSLKERIALSADTYAFVFETPKKLSFSPGQYMEWTLPHKNADSRGNRRYFSIASSPTQKDLVMAVKFYNPSSTYKRTLMNMQAGEKIIASQIAGDFVMPKNLKKKLVFLAGGVGIAPFKSMVEYIIENNLQVDIVLIFSNKTPRDVLFSNLLENARANGIRTVYTVSDTQGNKWEGWIGRINEKLIMQEVPDFAHRTFYISGPQLMVQNLEVILKNMRIPKKQIITDYFPGYVETI